MSGSSNAVWAVSDETIDYTHKFAKHIGCSVDELRECLLTKSTDFLLEKTEEFVSFFKFGVFERIHWAT